MSLFKVIALKFLTTKVFSAMKVQKLLVALFLFIFAQSLYSSTITSTAAGGNWSIGTSWIGGVAPGNADDVVLASGATLTLDADFLTSATLTVNGTATIQLNGFNLTTGSLISASSNSLINNGGSISTFTNGSLNSSTTFSGTISGSINLVKVGSGNFNLGTNALNINNLTINAGALTSTTGNFSLAGDFTNNSTFTSNAGTVIFNGFAIQTIGGASITSFNNISVTNTQPLAITTNILVSGIFTVAAGAKINPSATVVIGGSGSLTGNGNVLVTRTAATADFLSQYTLAATLTNLTVEYAVLTGGQTISALTYGNLKLDNTSGTNTIAGSVVINGIFTPTAGTGILSTAFDITFNLNTGCGGSINASAGTVTYARLSGAQSIMGGSYANLSLLNNSGTETACGNLTVTGSLTTTAGGTLNMATFLLSTATVINNGTIRTQNTSANPLPSFPSWGGTVRYDRTTGSQTVLSSTYTNLYIGNTSGVNTATGNIVVSGTITTLSNGTFDLGTYTLTGTLTAIANAGTIKTSNTTATPIPTGKTWNGTIEYGALTGGQTVVSATSYNNLKLDNTSGTNSAGNNIVVNGTLTTTTGGIFNLGNTNTLSGTLSTILNNGTITTSVPTATSATPIASGKSWGGTGTVSFNAATGLQTVVAGTYNTLTLANTSGTQTIAAGGISATNFNINGGTVDVAANSLIISNIARAGTNTFTISTGSFTVNGDLALTATDPITFSGAGSLTVSGNLTCGTLTGNSGTINIGGTFSPNTYTINTSTVNFNGSASQIIPVLTGYYNLNISNGQVNTLGGNVSVSNILTLNSGIIELGSSNLTLTNNANGAIAGTFGSTKMISTNGSGYLIRNALTTLPIAYPVGSNSVYSPFSVTVTSATTGTINIRAVTPNPLLGANFIKKYWDIVTTSSNKNINASFTYDASEISGSPTNYTVWSKPGAAIWATPPAATFSSSVSVATNTFSITTSTINTGSNYYFSAGLPATYYSYQSGNWNDPTTWTFDPGGSTQTSSSVPGLNDKVVILNQRTVSLSANVTDQNLDITIDNGGFLDLSGFQFTNTLLSLSGQGTVKLASASFPSATTNTFLTAAGGTTEYNLGITLPIGINTYNNLTINKLSGTVIQTNPSLTILGNLLVKAGTYQINDDVSTIVKSLTVNGNVTVSDNTGFIRVGKGPTNTTTVPSSVAVGGAAPFTNYYSQGNKVTIKGDFTNNGTVAFTNLSYPIYDAFPPTSAGATSGFATVCFTGSTDNSLTCNGITDFYNLILDKGSDQTNILSVYATSYSNFRLFGANAASIESAVANPLMRKALWIRTGTLKLSGLIAIPSLTEGTNTVAPTSDYFIPANGALVLDGPDVIVLSSADNYVEVNAAYGLALGSNVCNTNGGSGGSGLAVLGKLQVNNGYLSTRESGGLLYWTYSQGQIILNNGTIDTKQFHNPQGGTAALVSFRQTGGNMKLRGRFPNTINYPTVASLATPVISTVRANNGIDATAGVGTFHIINDATKSNGYTVGGGNINIYDVCTTTSPTAFYVNCQTSNINVTGGTLQIIPTSGTVLADANYSVNSLASFGNLIVNRTSGTNSVVVSTALNILKNLNITSGVLDVTGQNVTIGGNFSMANNTTYTNTLTTLFNGTGKQKITIDLSSSPIPLFVGLSMNKVASDTLIFIGSQNTINLGNLTLIAGNLDDNGKTINVSGNIYNGGSHISSNATPGKIVLNNDATIQTIDGNGSGSFLNLELNKPNAGTLAVKALNNFKINGVLSFSGSGNKPFNIQSYNLKLDASATISNADANKYIQTSGKYGDGGITKVYSATSSSFKFEFGAPTINPATQAVITAAGYAPCTLNITGTPTSWGSITVVPVGYEHPNTTNKNRSLTYFWRVKSGDGLSLGAATISHSYTYAAKDIVTSGGDPTEAQYVPGRFDRSTNTWTNGTSASINTGTHTMTNPAAWNSLIDGEYTAGDNNPTNPFGIPTKFYSRQSGNWNLTSTWSTVSSTGAVASRIPAAGDIVIIGNYPTRNDSVFQTTSFTVANSGVQNCASIQIMTSSVLDVGNNANSNYGVIQSNTNGNGKFKVSCTNSGAGLPIVIPFPSGDFSDFNNNAGTTQYYTGCNCSGQYYLSPSVTTYGNINFAPRGSDNMIFPNSDVTIKGNFTTYPDAGTNRDSWICSSWYDGPNNGSGATMAWHTPGVYNTIEKTIHITGNFNINGGMFVIPSDNYVPQHIVVDGDVIIAPAAAFDVVWAGGVNYFGTTATANTFTIGGKLINNSDSVRLNYNNGNRYVDLVFNGNSDGFLTNTTSPGPKLHLHNLTINKGNSQATLLTINFSGSIQYQNPSNAWLNIQSGTLVYKSATNLPIALGTQFTIPSTAGLTLDNTAATVTIGNNSISGTILNLGGKLKLGSNFTGIVNIGNNVIGNANHNDIEYTSAGASAIEVNNGTLNVTGQIRRNISSSAGVLSYTQTGGKVTILGNGIATAPSNAANAKLEVLNNGSQFNMSGNGVLYIARGGGNNTYGDLYLRPQTGSVTGGYIYLADSTVGSAQVFQVDANIPLNNLTIKGTTGATARLMVSPLILNGNLTLTNATSTLNAVAVSGNSINVTLNGNVRNGGSAANYLFGTNLTTFNALSTSPNAGQQTITGALNFYDLNVSPGAWLKLNSNTLVGRNLTIGSGVLDLKSLGNYLVTVNGNILNNGAYIDNNAAVQGVLLTGAAYQQHIGGSGTFGRLDINNLNYGAEADNTLTLTNDLVITNGIFNIGSYLLTLGQSSLIGGSPFSKTKMITTDGVFSNIGIKKFFSTGAQPAFTYPLGTSGKYTPAVVTITANSSVGSVRVNNINARIPACTDPANVLAYFWDVESSGISSFSGNMDLNYMQSDVVGNELGYQAARLSGTTWSETNTVNTTTNIASFSFTSVSLLDGQYTAGVASAFPPNVPTYTSIADGNWTNTAIWSQTGGTPFPCPAGGPNGFNVVINNTVTANANYCMSFQTTINGKLQIVSPYFGHNLGIVNGSGTLYVETSNYPAGVYKNFLSCLNNGTLEYGGTGTYQINADLFDNIPNMVISGTGSRLLPNKDLTICNSLKINSATLDNSLYNRKLIILGSMERSAGGSFIAGSGNGATVSFSGSNTQSLGGATGDFTSTNCFNNLEINNDQNLTIGTNGLIEVAGNLLLTNGYIKTTASNKLTIINTAVNCVIPSAGSSSSFVDGPLLKKINQGDYFLFPVGQGLEAGNKLTVSSTKTGTQLWSVQYINPNSTYKFFDSPIYAVSWNEFWRVTSPSGDSAVININWDNTSDITPLSTMNGISDIGIAQYYTGLSKWEALTSTALGDNNNGTVTSGYRAVLATGTDFTIASVAKVLPKAKLKPTGAICGSSALIPVSFSAPYTIPTTFTITYSVNGTLQAPISGLTGNTSITASSTGVYKLESFTYNSGAFTGVADGTTVTAYAMPTTANAGPNQSICGLTSATLAGNTPVITGTGTWSIVNGAGGTVINPAIYNSTFLGTNGSGYTLKYTISTGGGCKSSSNVSIQFPVAAAAATGFISSQSNVCRGNAATFSVPNDASVNYTWTYSGSGAAITPSIPANSASFSFNTSATSGNVSVTTSNGCGVSSPLVYSVTVNLLPNSGLTVSDPIVCGGNSASVIVSSGEANTDYTLRLNTNNSLVNTVNNILVGNVTLTSGALASNTVFNVLATTAFGCTAQLTDLSNVTVNPAPIINMGGSISTCGTDITPVSVTSLSNYASLLWTISSGTGSLINSTTATPTYTAGSNADATVILNLNTTALPGCTNATVNNKTINVYQAPGTSLISHD